MIDKTKIEQLISKKVNIEVFDELPSTNDYAKNSECHKDSVIISKRQTKGKGRNGKTFMSPKGGLYMSIVICPDTFDAGEITCKTAVAVANAIEKVSGVKCDIKWVNDIYINNKKVCGILCESVFSKSGKLEKVIVGIGINVLKHSFPKEVDNIATSLEQEGIKTPDQNPLAASVIEEFFKTVENDDFMQEYKRRSIIVGKDITVIKNNSDIFTAKAVGISDDGGLIIEALGKREVLHYGEVSIKPKER